MHRLSAVLLIGAIAFAQPAAAPRTARVGGRVIRQTGEGVRRATVTLLGAKRYTGTTDADGVFAFDGVAPGTYALIAQRVGYASQKYGATGPLVRHCVGVDGPVSHGLYPAEKEDAAAVYRQCIEHAPGTMLSLAADQEMQDLVISIAQHGVISGKVLNQDSEPIQGGVAGMKVSYERGVRRLELVSSVLIGPDGEYTVDDLPPGRYYLRATIISRTSLPGEGKASPDADVATYYPGESDISKAGPVEVRPGEELSGVDILVRRVRVFSVRGTVASEGNIRVELNPKKPNVASRRSSLAVNGVFEFRDVEPGEYVISSTRMPTAQTLLRRQDVVVSAADVEGVHLEPVQGIAVSGTVKVEGVNPGTSPTVGLTAFDTGSGPAKFDSKGAFTFSTNVAPSIYEVRLGAPPGTYVKSIRYGRQDALRGTLDLTGGAAGSLDIVLSSKVAAITGKVTNASGDAVPGALVTAWPGSPELTGGVKTASTDQNGNFEIADLGPGGYFVAAWEDIEPGLAEYPGFLGRFKDSAVTIKLEEGGAASADVKLVPRERIASEVAELP